MGMHSNCCRCCRTAVGVWKVICSYWKRRSLTKVDWLGSRKNLVIGRLGKGCFRFSLDLKWK